MAAAYPNALAAFIPPTKQDHVNVVEATHMNRVQEEIRAIQTAVGLSPATVPGTPVIPAAVVTVADRMERLEALLASLSVVVGGVAAVPTGTVLSHAGSVAPTGFLRCDGTDGPSNDGTVPRTGTTAALFAVIGTKFGNGDGSTTFTLPNFVGRFPQGALPTGVGVSAAGDSHNHTVSVSDHSLSDSEIPSHVHRSNLVNHFHLASLSDHAHTERGQHKSIQAGTGASTTITVPSGTGGSGNDILANTDAAGAGNYPTDGPHDVGDHPFSDAGWRATNTGIALSSPGTGHSHAAGTGAASPIKPPNLAVLYVIKI